MKAQTRATLRPHWPVRSLKSWAEKAQQHEWNLGGILCVWTDTEVELLLSVTVKYKVNKIQENVWRYPCSFPRVVCFWESPEVPNFKEAITRTIITTNTYSNVKQNCVFLFIHTHWKFWISSLWQEFSKSSIFSDLKHHYSTEGQYA